jgi:hypothetical protein
MLIYNAIALILCLVVIEPLLILLWVLNTVFVIASIQKRRRVVRYPTIRFLKSAGQ